MREAIERCLEEDLGLAVNREKNEVAKVKDVPFAGFQILRGKIRVSDKATAKFKDRARKLTRRNNALSMYQVIHYLNEYLGGWVAYFRVQEFNSAKTGQRPGCLDTKPAEVNAAEQMEGPKEVPGNDDPKRLQAPGSSKSLGQDEQMAIAPEGGPLCYACPVREPSMVQSAGTDLPRRLHSTNF